MTVQADGATIWIADPADNSAKRINCVINFTPGELERAKDDTRCLEDKDSKGDNPGTTVTAADTSLSAFWDDDDVFACICQWFAGRDLAEGETFEDGFCTQIAVALCNGCVMYFSVWVHKLGLDTIESENKLQWTITWATKSCWCDTKGDWENGTAPTGFVNWSTAIDAYYAAAEAGGGGPLEPVAGAFKAKQVTQTTKKD